MKRIKNGRRICLALIDLVCFAAVYVTVCVIGRLTLTELQYGLRQYIYNAMIFIAAIACFRIAFSVYINIWRYANSKAYLQMVAADFSACLAAFLIARALGVSTGFLQNAFIVISFDLMTLLTRFVYQQYYRYLNINIGYINQIGVAIVGAGQIGALLADELTYNAQSHYRPICFIDNNTAKIGNRLRGLKIYPENEQIFDTLKSLPVQEIFIALPNISGDTAKKLYDFYSRSNCKVKLYDFPINKDDDDAGKRVIREIKIEDLLFRNALDISDEKADTFYKDKTVLITGGGGSIGSELCRQVAARHPKRLVIIDIYENNAYEIEQELIRKYGDELTLDVEIASVRDKTRLDAIFEAYRPEIVFHAAAHKHVPLMEHSAGEAIKNNVLGTYNTANAAEKYGAEKFILISTDKAVNPTNIMGASKRLCEMIVQCRNDSKTSFSAVRFGNVLGSNGSVIPLFKRQIAKGGPVTLTDKRIIRYFMTIPEAAQLVMQAGCMANRGELFVLDMGNPIRILDLAENMIKLSGLRPYQDIDIVEVGLRPGEKLYEELLIKTENLDKTDNNLIFIERDQPLTRAQVDTKLEILQLALDETADTLKPDKIKLAIKSVVPTYCEPEAVNEKAYLSEEMHQAAPRSVGAEALANA